ncbi:MAG: HTH-type transcriptional regulator HexR [Paracidovorax wautersii]|uniref:HTH-type transcriptional regulator HexR n=1 Tax=Paracidovorax wautersii TaxID=1177982 RepID=A0A7V8JQ48_9BURK|nr:MAG: HTH-type transcriptional regulator HexR [Paracidovorax wautersii]
MSLQALIRQRHASLSPTLQQAARYVIDHPNAVVTESMRAVSARSGVAPTTLLRLAQQLGFEGWPQLKEALTQDMGLAAEKSYGHRACQLAGRGQDAALVAELFEVHKRNLSHTEQQASHSLPRAARVLEQVRRVHVAGFRACFPVAHSLLYVYRLFRHEVQLIDGQGGSLEMQARAIAPEDALLVVSFAPYSREALEVARAAHAAGAAIVALTDSAASPLSLMARETVLFTTQSPSFFPSVAAAMAVAESLLELLATRAGQAGIERIDAAETQLRQSGAYLPD